MLAIISANPILFGMLFLLLNLGIGWLLVWIAEHSPAAPFFQRHAGVVAPFIAMLVILFSLWAAFLANDVWIEGERARGAVAREADAVRALVGITGALGERGKALNGLVAEYVGAATNDSWHAPPQRAMAERQIQLMLHEGLFGAIATVGGQVQRVAVDSIMELRNAFRERVAVAHSRTAMQKWIAAFVLGILSAISLVFVQIGNARAGRLAVTLFAAAMAFTLWVILVRIDPFSGPSPVTLQPIKAAVAVG